MIQLNPQKHSRARFWSLLAVLLALCFVRYALRINLPRTVLLVVAAVIMLAGDRDEVIAMCICCIPLHESIDLYYTLVIWVIIYAMRFSKSIRINLAIIPIFFMIVWELLHCVNASFSVMKFVANCAPLLPLAILLCTDSDGLDYDFIIRAYCATMLATSATLLIKLVHAADFNFVVAFANLQRLGQYTEETAEELAVVGGNINANSLGILCSLGATGLMQIWQAGRKKRWNPLLIILLLVFGALTSSRTYLVCLLLMAVLLIFSQKGGISRKLKLFGIIVAVILIALGVLYLVFPALVEFYIGRFQAEDLTTGRLDAMVIYHDFIVSNPTVMLFGIGLQDYAEKVIEIWRVMDNIPHNGIQELIVAWGVPGLIMFLMLWLVMVLRSRQCCAKQGLINYIPLLVILLKAQAGQMLSSAYTMLAFSFAYLSMCADLTATDPQALDETI